MSRYIDIDKVLKELCLNHKDVIYIDKNECAKRIEKINGIDIVRCGECKHWNHEEELTYCDKTVWFGTDADDFCSYGERSE